jgi:hypothetical protein
MRNFLFILLVGASACAARSSHSTVPTAYGAAEARSGEGALVSRYLQGESLDELASDLSVGDRDEARDAVHRAMQDLQRRYYTEQ